MTTVEAAFVWAHNGRTVLFSGQEYWGFSPGNDIGNPKPDKGYPKAASLWAGVPSDPDDVITFGEGKGTADNVCLHGKNDSGLHWMAVLAKIMNLFYMFWFSLHSGGTYFFKDNSYWIIENGRLGQDRVTSKSTATEWMKCSQKEAPTPRPGRGDCSCALNGASEIAPLRNQWISLILTVTFLQILFMI